MIPFNKPFLCGMELEYIREAVSGGKISGDGIFTGKCQQFLENRYGFKKVLLTTSCTDALEMAALLCNISEGDEVIAPSFSFVSTVNPFVMRGAKIVFCDVRADYPCIDENAIERLITPKTKVIVVVHYAGIACNMDVIMQIAGRHNLLVVEDAAHAIDAYYKGKPLGGIGDFGTFSFHETKNIIAGEGGAIVLNNKTWIDRAEIIREKGTNRSQFFRGEIDKYSWVDIGSSFLPSEITAAFLYAQLENIERIQAKRKTLWNAYFEGLGALVKSGRLSLPVLPSFASNNAHLFFILTGSRDERAALIQHLEELGIMAIFHYVPLHSSPFFGSQYRGDELANTDRYADVLLRLPLYYELTLEEVRYILECINAFYVRA
jgi:dTDP-4-amino-4,6-dideoxygalactose transaminase